KFCETRRKELPKTTKLISDRSSNLTRAGATSSDGKISSLYHYIFYRLGVGRQNDRACEWLWGSELMPNTRKILIVDDDPQLRDALTEQLSLLEELDRKSTR